MLQTNSLTLTLAEIVRSQREGVRRVAQFCRVADAAGVVGAKSKLLDFEEKANEAILELSMLFLAVAEHTPKTSEV